MDPSINLCLGYDSLLNPPPLLTDPNIWYSSPEPTPLSPNYTLIKSTEYPLAKYCDLKLYDILQQIKDTFDHPTFLQARNATNPFEYIGRSIFFTRAAIKLANTDTVYHVTNHTFTFENKTTDKPFTFCDIAAGPGSFTQYLQYRFPQSRGYGITLKHKTLDWDPRMIDFDRFYSFYGPDQTGNLYTNWEPFIAYMRENEAEGVDLITGDGGFDIEEGGNVSLLKHQEFLSSRLLISQSIIGISCTKVGGNFVLKVFDTVNNFSAQVIFVLAQCFREILIFKPCASRPGNSERYLICRQRLLDTAPYQVLLSHALQQYSDDTYLTSLFAEPLPLEFEAWLTNLNNRSINLQLQTAKNILSFINNTPYTLPSYNIPKFLVIWNLPDNPPHPKYDSIIVR